MASWRKYVRGGVARWRKYVRGRGGKVDKYLRGRVARWRKYVKGWGDKVKEGASCEDGIFYAQTSRFDNFKNNFKGTLGVV